MGKQFKEAYTAQPHLRHPPGNAAGVAAVCALRAARHAACQAHGGAVWATSPHGRTECAFCAVYGGSATQCRVTGPSCSGHGPTLFTDTDGHVKGGPDADVSLFPVGAVVTCAKPAFTGTVTKFDVLSGEHTLKLADGTERCAFLGYLTGACTVTYPQGAHGTRSRSLPYIHARRHAGVPKPSHELPCKPKRA
jgi:hypothetical protein